MLIKYSSLTLNDPKKLSLENRETRRRFIHQSQILLALSLLLFGLWLGVAANLSLAAVGIFIGIGMLLVLLSPLKLNKILDKLIRQIQVDRESK